MLSLVMKVKTSREVAHERLCSPHDDVRPHTAYIVQEVLAKHEMTVEWCWCPPQFPQLYQIFPISTRFSSWGRERSRMELTLASTVVGEQPPWKPQTLQDGSCSNPLHSPELAPSDFFLFLKIIIMLKWRRFDTVEGTQAETQTVLTN
jgi:hypothetical protein